MEPAEDFAAWENEGLEYLLCFAHKYEGFTSIQNRQYYFQRGIAFSTIGADFSARVHRYPSIIGHKGSSLFPEDVSGTLCAMNSSPAREILHSLNPTIGFEVGDVNRLPVFQISNSAEILSFVERSFGEHESHREPSVEFRRPGPSSWRHTQECAQAAVDRPNGMARLALLDAQQSGFATSFVVVSDNDLRFHRFDDVYRKVMTELGTASCPRGALGDILDRWIGRIEEKLMAAGEDDASPDFEPKVRRRLDEDLAALTGGQAPPDFVRVIQTIFDLKQRGEVAEAGALIAWLCGSGNVAASAKKAAGIKGDIGSRDALDYLRGVLEIVKEAGYAGLLIVIDEAETILRMRADSRHKSLNGIRQIADAAGSYPGLLWLFTGTPEFFDSRQGVAGLAPLHDRIRFLKQGCFASLRQAQLELAPFDADRLRSVALRLRELFPSAERSRVDSRVSMHFREDLAKAAQPGPGLDK